jgi:hypothetical protein
LTADLGVKANHSNLVLVRRIARLDGPAGLSSSCVGGLLDVLRNRCAEIADSARNVRVNRAAIPGFTASLHAGADPDDERLDVPLGMHSREQLTAFWLTLDAVNFGSGWFPTLRKRSGRSGYHTIADALRERFETEGAWGADELAGIRSSVLALALDQDPGHELMALYASSLRDLGARVEAEHGGLFAGVVDSAGWSATRLVEHLAGWDCFRDTSSYRGLSLPFLKRAQIAAADLHRAGVAAFGDISQLTMFADNLVPHVLRLDGILGFDPRLVDRIEREELLEPGSEEEVEIRACSVHAVELIVAARPDLIASEVDQALWLRGQQPVYKASPRHRCRCTAY